MFTHTSAMMPMSEAAMAHLVSQEGSFDARRYGRVRLWGSLGFLVTVFAAGAWFEQFGMADFPGWTLATLVAVVASTWLCPGWKRGSLLPAPVMAPGLPWPRLAQAPGAVVFRIGLFSRAGPHCGLRVLLAVPGCL